MRQALIWFAIALALRMGAMLAVDSYSRAMGYGGYMPLDSGADDIQYDQYATAIADGNIPTWYPTSYPLVIAFVYKYIARSLLVAKAFNALAGAVAVLFGVLICQFFATADRDDSRAAANACHICGLFLCLYPSAVLYSALLTKDSLLLLSGLATMYFTLRLQRSGNVLWFAPLGLSFYCLFDLRSYIALSFLGACGCWILFRARPIAWASRRPILASGVLVCITGVTYYGVRLYQSYFNVEMLEMQRATYAGGSSAGLSLDFSSPGQFIFSYLLNVAYIVVSPLPWQVSKPQQILVLIESLPLLVTSPIWLVGIVSLFWRRSPQVSFLLVAAGFQMLAFGLLSDNAGSNARLRLLACSLFIIYMSVTYLHWLRWLGIEASGAYTPALGKLRGAEH